MSDKSLNNKSPNKNLNDKITPYNRNQEKVKKFFLEKAIDVKEAPKPYLIENEFNKTKENQNYSNLFILLSSCAFIIISSLLIVNIYEKTQEKEKINIKIEEFSDIDIHKVLIQANNFKNELLQKKRELIGLETQKKDELQKSFSVYNNEVKKIVNNNTLSSGVKRNKNQLLFNERKQQEAAILAKYQGKINELQDKINDLVKKVSILDQRAIEKAIKTDDFAGYQGELLDVRIENLEKSK